MELPDLWGVVGGLRRAQRAIGITTPLELRAENVSSRYTTRWGDLRTA